MLKDNLKSARLKAGLTLDEVAQKVGVSRQTIQRYESGVIQNIPSDNIEKIAGVLGVSPGLLMGWEVPLSSTSKDVKEQEPNFPAILARAEKELPPEKLRDLADMAEFYLNKYGKKKGD